MYSIVDYYMYLTDVLFTSKCRFYTGNMHLSNNVNKIIFIMIITSTSLLKYQTYVNRSCFSSQTAVRKLRGVWLPPVPKLMLLTSELITSLLPAVGKQHTRALLGLETLQLLLTIHCDLNSTFTDKADHFYCRYLARFWLHSLFPAPCTHT